MNDFRYSYGLKRHILIIDDEEINREILGNMLKNDYEISFADNGAMAYEMLKDHSLKISLILLDLLMPVMDGFEFLEKI